MIVNAAVICIVLVVFWGLIWLVKQIDKGPS